MTTGGLQSFVHGTQKITTPANGTGRNGYRFAPSKLVADEAAYKGQRYANVEVCLGVQSQVCMP